MIELVLGLFLSLCVGVTIDVTTGLLTALFFILGRTAVYCFNSDAIRITRIYSISYLCSLFYALICHIYMTAHGYDCLLIGDTAYYLNRLREALSGAHSLYDVISPLWQDYDLLIRGNTGYIAFIGVWEFLAKSVGADVYFTIQLATLTICSLGSVIIYKLLSYHISNEKYIWKMTWILSLCPMFFQYTTFIVRDGLIALCFYYIILLLHKKPSITVIALLLLMSLIITTIRTETGLASLMFLPMVLIIQNKANSNRSTIIKIGVIASLAFLAYYLYNNMASLSTLYYDNYDNYFTKTKTESGVISFLDKVPVIGPMINVIYGVIQPVPCWARLSTYYMPLLPLKNLYNIMGFPSIIYVAFNTYIVVYLIFFLFKKKNTKIDLGALKGILVPSAIFLLLQSGIVEPRRIMGVFPVFYIIWAMAYYKMPKKYNNDIFLIFSIVFILIQVVGLIRF